VGKIIPPLLGKSIPPFTERGSSLTIPTRPASDWDIRSIIRKFWDPVKDELSRPLVPVEDALEV